MRWPGCPTGSGRRWCCATSTTSPTRRSPITWGAASQPCAADQNDYPTVLGLSGPFVIVDDTSHVLALDTRTGAATTLTTSQPPTTSAGTGADTLALDVVGSKGGARLVLADLATLPGLHC